MACSIASEQPTGDRCEGAANDGQCDAYPDQSQHDDRPAKQVGSCIAGAIEQPHEASGPRGQFEDQCNATRLHAGHDAIDGECVIWPSRPSPFGSNPTPLDWSQALTRSNPRRVSLGGRGSRRDLTDLSSAVGQTVYDLMQTMGVQTMGVELPRFRHP